MSSSIDESGMQRRIAIKGAVEGERVWRRAWRALRWGRGGSVAIGLGR